MTKKKKQSNNEVTVLEDIIANLNEKNRRLDDKINNLKEQLEVAYGVNGGLIDEQKDEESYRNLTQLSTLLMVLMNLVIPHCNDSLLGQAVGKAIKRYQITMAKSLVNDTIFIREEDKEDWEEEDDEDESSEIWYDEDD